MLILSGLLVVFHTPSNAGYAMTPLEKMFFQVACELTGDVNKVHFAFSNLDNGMPTSLPADFSNVISLDKSSSSGAEFKNAEHYIQKNKITAALCFDLQPHSDLCNLLRRAGVTKLVSYWGSTMSEINHGVKLALKKVEVALTRKKPNLFIFESEAMQRHAVFGRGIKQQNTSVIPTGVDTAHFCPNSEAKSYVETHFSIPSDKKIAFYSGHMEERKGVRVIIEAAIELVDFRGLDHIYFLICGNRPGEEQPFLDLLQGTKAMNNVIFAGYRTDLDQIMPGCDFGVIASTGWDSFPMSSLEMASCGLPLIVSALQGLIETIDDQKTGFMFEPGNSHALSSLIATLDSDEKLANKLSQAARKRILNKFTLQHQKQSLAAALRNVIA